MTLIWLKTPVLWHSSREWSPYDPEGALTFEEFTLIRGRWRNWYTADLDYARTTVYLFCAGIIVWGLANVIFKLRQSSSTARAVQNKLPGYNKAIAASRSLGAKQIHVPIVNYYSPPLSAIGIVLGLIVFFTALTFAVHPYNWPNPAMGHSQPIATRTGWISIAILPFLLVLATKVNLIGMVTGVSHEKLQVYHRWTAWIMYITSLIHTFPFIVGSIHHGEMVTNWNTTPWYWTGVAALIPQTWLVFMSWGPVRNRYYETFKKLHFVASVIFVVALFIHCNFRLTSWDYFLVTVVLYGVSWLARVGRTLYNGLNSQATLEALPENMVKITIPTKLKWRPGQHFFVRFLDLGIHAASSHPFTVATLPNQSEGKEGAVMEIYARVHGGITARLAALAKKGAAGSSRVLLDGPYGGVEANLKVYDRVLLLAGGSGVTFVVPLLLDLVRSYEPGKTACRSVHLVWAVRTNDALSWFEDVLDNTIKALPEGLSVSISYHVTDVPAIVNDDASTASEKGAGEADAVTKHTGRPNLPSIVKELCAEEGAVAVVACGPESFNCDVGSAVSECEMAILRGKSACSEIYLHQEAYRSVLIYCGCACAHEMVSW
ncbi:ferric reductase NAD binding domain-containing protein [Earliella scabrosa]|nr:ferric reductase NAD binding domain-containing protein [Earliella scabrosa]